MAIEEKKPSIYIHSDPRHIKVINKCINSKNYKQLCTRFKVKPKDLHVYTIKSQYQLDESCDIDIKLEPNTLYILDTTVEEFDDYNNDYFMYLNKALLAYVLYSINMNCNSTLIEYFSIVLSDQYDKAYDELSDKDKQASTVAKNIYNNKGDKEVINIILNNDITKFVKYSILYI